MCICYSVSSIHLTTNFYLRDGLFGNLVPRGQTLGNNVLTIEFDKDLIDLIIRLANMSVGTSWFLLSVLIALLVTFSLALCLFLDQITDLISPLYEIGIITCGRGGKWDQER